MTDHIAGSFGGGGSKKKKRRAPAPVPQPTVVQHVYQAPAPRAPVRTPDTLSSTQYATFLDLVSEGEIEGFPSAREYKNPPVDENGDTIVETTEEEEARLAKYEKAKFKDIFLNDVPILDESADLDEPEANDFNFEGVEVAWRPGTQDQSYIDGFGDIETDITVDNSIPVKKDSPVTRTLYNTTLDAIRVTISLPRLQRFTTYGDIYGSEVEIRILRKFADETEYTIMHEDKFSGRTADLYTRDYKVELDGAFPVSVQVERVTEDPPDEQTQNEIYWTVYTELVEQRLRYPNSALVATRFNAQDFGSIPNRTFRLRGVKVPIPNGATVDQENGRIIYPENFIWDGTFTVPQWTSCPAMLLLECLTNSTWGFGDHISLDQLDRWSFLEASKYSCELIDKGDGTTEQEPRFSCNAVIRNADNAYKLINDLSSVFRCMTYWATGTIQISQDRPRDSSYLFNNSNVLEGGFLYSNASQKTRHTVVTVSFFNSDLRTQDYVVAEDQDAVRKWGVVQTEITAFACTSRTQAQRLAKWLLYVEQAESQVVEFKTSVAAGVVVRPGTIITIVDELLSGTRIGGRIRDVRLTTGGLYVLLDTALDEFVPWNKFTYVSKSGRVLTATDIAFECPPDDGLEASIVLKTSGLSQEEYPVIAAPYALEGDQAGGAGSLWRTISVAEEEPGIYTVTAMAHNPGKYDYIESGIPIQYQEALTLELNPTAPEELNIEEVLYSANGSVKSKFVISWEAQLGAQAYRVLYRQAGKEWQSIETPNNSVDIPDIEPGEYEISVFTVGVGFTQSAQSVDAAYTAVGKTEPPEKVENVNASTADYDPQEGERWVRVTWKAASELDVLNGGSVVIHKCTSEAKTWAESYEVVRLPGNSTSSQFQVSGDSQTFLIAFEDDGGRVSTTPAHIEIESSEEMNDAYLTLWELRLHEGKAYYLPGTSDEVVTEFGEWAGLYYDLIYDKQYDTGGAVFLAGYGTTIDTWAPNHEIFDLVTWGTDFVFNWDLKDRAARQGTLVSSIDIRPVEGKWMFYEKLDVEVTNNGTIINDQIAKFGDGGWNYGWDSVVDLDTGANTPNSKISFGLKTAGDLPITSALQSNFATTNTYVCDPTNEELTLHPCIQITRSLRETIGPDWRTHYSNGNLPFESTPRLVISQAVHTIQIKRRETGTVIKDVNITAATQGYVEFNHAFYTPPTVISLSAGVTVDSITREGVYVTPTSDITQFVYIASGYGKDLT